MCYSKNRSRACLLSCPLLWALGILLGYSVVLICLNSAGGLSDSSFLIICASFITNLDVFVDPGKHFTKICEDPRRSLIIFLHIVSPSSTTAQTPGSHTSKSPSPFLILAHEGTSWISLLVEKALLPSWSVSVPQNATFFPHKDARWGSKTFLRTI